MNNQQNSGGADVPLQPLVSETMTDEKMFEIIDGLRYVVCLKDGFRVVLENDVAPIVITRLSND